MVDGSRPEGNVEFLPVGRQPALDGGECLDLDGLDGRVDVAVRGAQVGAMVAIAQRDGLLGSALDVQAVSGVGRLTPWVT